jgi:hypothetical protein
MDDTATSEADKTLFGTMNADIADQFANYVDEALEDGVATLPFLDAAKQQIMKGLLRKKFMKNVDVFEFYCKHNIFTLKQQTPKRVADVLRLFQELPEGTIPDIIQVPETSLSEEEEQLMDLQTRELPLPADIPTREQLAQLEQEIVALRQSYQKILHQRVALEQETKTWEAAQNLASFASETLQQVLSDPQKQVIHPVSKVVQVQPQLVGSIQLGQELLEELSESAKRSDSEHDGVYLLGQFKKPKLTLDDRIQAMTELSSDENNANGLLQIISASPTAKSPVKATTPFRIPRRSTDTYT